MMRILVQGIKEKRGIIYKAPTTRRVLQYGWQRGGKGVHSFWIVTQDTYVKIYSMNYSMNYSIKTYKNERIKMYSLRTFYICFKQIFKKCRSNE